MNPRITQVQTTNDYQLILTFNNNEKGLFDCKYLLNIGVFKELKNLDYFKKVKVESGTVVWPNEQDLCPDTLYQATKILK